MEIGKKLFVKQTGSISGRTQEVIATLQALGLGRIGKSRTITVNPAIWGMLKKVRHLVQVELAKTQR